RAHAERFARLFLDLVDRRGTVRRRIHLQLQQRLPLEEAEVDAVADPLAVGADDPTADLQLERLGDRAGHDLRDPDHSPRLTIRGRPSAAPAPSPGNTERYGPDQPASSDVGRTSPAQERGAPHAAHRVAPGSAGSPQFGQANRTSPWRSMCSRTIRCAASYS